DRSDDQISEHVFLDACLSFTTQFVVSVLRPSAFRREPPCPYRRKDVIEQFEVHGSDSRVAIEHKVHQCPTEIEFSPLMFCITRKHVQQWCIDHNEDPVTDEEMTKLFLILHRDRHEIIDNGLYCLYS